MSADLNADMAKSLGEATASWNNFTAAHNIFIANCQRLEFEMAEAEREKLHAALDCYLDGHMAAHRRLEIARHG